MFGTIWQLTHVHIAQWSEITTGNSWKIVSLFLLGNLNFSRAFLHVYNYIYHCHQLSKANNKYVHLQCTYILLNWDNIPDVVCYIRDRCFLSFLLRFIKNSDPPYKTTTAKKQLKPINLMSPSPFNFTLLVQFSLFENIQLFFPFTQVDFRR